MSGYVYNLGNELTSTHGLVDACLAADGNVLRHAQGLPRQRKRRCAAGSHQQSDCNGYWRRLRRTGASGLIHRHFVNNSAQILMHY